MEIRPNTSLLQALSAAASAQVANAKPDAKLLAAKAAARAAFAAAKSPPGAVTQAGSGSPSPAVPQAVTGGGSAKVFPRGSFLNIIA